jgi:hypothetical protein
MKTRQHELRALLGRASTAKPTLPRLKFLETSFDDCPVREVAAIEIIEENAQPMAEVPSRVP